MKYRFLAFPGGKQKAVTFSYDDGVNQDIRLSELFCKYGVKGTFNVNSGLFGAPGVNSSRLTAEEIKENIIDKGHEVAVHGVNHIASAAASPTLCLKDAFECRRVLEDTFDCIIRGMAYPDSGIRMVANNNSYETVKNILTYSGIVYARSLQGDNDKFSLPEDFHAWVPTAHHDNPELFNWIDEFNSLKYDTGRSKLNAPRLLYIWGHSYEFDTKNNWDRIEEILKRVSGKDDVWYATNIEIYDYVSAYNSLIFSADETKVYNPTATTVWITYDCKTVKVEPKETLKLN